MKENQILKELAFFSTKIIIDFPAKVVYHDIKFAHRLVRHVRKVAAAAKLNEEESEMALITAWLLCTGYGGQVFENKELGLRERNVDKIAIDNGKKFFKSYPYPEEKQNIIFENLSKVLYPKIPETKIQKVVYDAIIADLAKGSGKKIMKNLHQELVLHDLVLSKRNWLEVILDIGENVKFYTNFGQKEYAPKFEKNLESIRKERKDLDKRSDLLLKKELNISDLELKKLKKTVANAKGRDDRGIQTLFRTASRNQYTLNAMVDRKANIMITVNSIILSLVIGGVLESSKEFKYAIQGLPVVMLSLCCTVSIIYAILSIRPNVTQGEFSEDEIRSKKGNLLFFGNFHNMHSRDYEWGFLQMMNDKDYLYSTMVKDIYYLGLALNKKYKYLRISLNIFLIGLVLAFIINLIVRAYLFL